jgi:hypothetical protein
MYVHLFFTCTLQSSFKHFHRLVWTAISELCNTTFDSGGVPPCYEAHQDNSQIFWWADWPYEHTLQSILTNYLKGILMNLTTKQQQAVNELQPHQSNYWTFMPRVNLLFDYLRANGINAMQRDDRIDEKDERPHVYYGEESWGITMMEKGFLRLHYDVDAIPILIEGCKECDILYDWNEDPDETFVIYQSKSWIEYEFSIEEDWQEYGLNHIDSLKGTVQDWVACAHDDVDEWADDENNQFIMRAMTILKMDDDLKYFLGCFKNPPKLKQDKAKDLALIKKLEDGATQDAFRDMSMVKH